MTDTDPRPTSYAEMSSGDSPAVARLIEFLRQWPMQLPRIDTVVTIQMDPTAELADLNASDIAVALKYLTGAWKLLNDDTATIARFQADILREAAQEAAENTSWERSKRHAFELFLNMKADKVMQRELDLGVEL